MGHLITPVSIGGASYCPLYSPLNGIPVRTAGVRTWDWIGGGNDNSAVITTPAGPWKLYEVEAGGSSGWFGEISFGMVCGSSVQVGISADSGNTGGFDYAVAVTDDGVAAVIHSGNLGAGGSASHTLVLSPTACSSPVISVFIDALGFGYAGDKGELEVLAVA